MKNAPARAALTWVAVLCWFGALFLRETGRLAYNPLVEEAPNMGPDTAMVALFGLCLLACWSALRETFRAWEA